MKTSELTPGEAFGALARGSSHPRVVIPLVNYMMQIDYFGHTIKLHTTTMRSYGSRKGVFVVSFNKTSEAQSIFDWLKDGKPTLEHPLVAEAWSRAAPLREKLPQKPGATFSFTREEWASFGVERFLPADIKGLWLPFYEQHTRERNEAQAEAELRAQENQRYRNAMGKAVEDLKGILGEDFEPSLHLWGSNKEVTLKIDDFLTIVQNIDWA